MVRPAPAAGVQQRLWCGPGTQSVSGFEQPGQSEVLLIWLAECEATFCFCGYGLSLLLHKVSKAPLPRYLHCHLRFRALFCPS